MTRRVMQWVNTPVLMEAILRYKQGNLPRSMKLWVEELLEISTPKNSLKKIPHERTPEKSNIYIV
tara:strand:+ start:160 stop:354 length:195 start_codon:yes stop_codon:yes gene_type:complete